MFSEPRDKPISEKLTSVGFIGGKIVNNKDESGKVITYISTERQIDNEWRISMLQPADKTQFLGYATQKPEALIERIITASSNEGDLILDCFCGSGTTLAVAEKLGRRWIGVDLGRYSVHTTRKRLIEVQRELHAAGQPYRSFDVYNLGRYERQWWQFDRLQVASIRSIALLVLRFYKAAPLATAPHPLLHGTRGGAFVMSIRSTASSPSTSCAIAAEAARAAGGRELHCLAWEFEMELAHKRGAVEAETGLSIRLKYIPREVMEPNRTEAQFFEAGYLEAHATARNGKVDVELTRFAPSLAEAPEKEMAALRERAISSPFDFIDFWAIDFAWSANKPFEQHWQDFRTRKDRSLKIRTDIGWKYAAQGTHQILCESDRRVRRGHDRSDRGAGITCAYKGVAAMTSSSDMTLEEKIHVLPNDLQREVEDFIEFLLAKQRRAELERTAVANGFEQEFADFCDYAADVVAFAKNAGPRNY